jgi:hypothetical protein
VNFSPLSTAVHVYQVLLHCYPPSFRREFGAEMVCDFDDASRDAWTAGGWSTVGALWLVVCVDFVRTVAMQWIRTGWPVLVGISLAVSLSCCALLAQQLVPRTNLSLPRTRSEEEMLLILLAGVVVFVLIAVTIVVTAAFWALVVRRTRRA